MIVALLAVVLCGVDGGQPAATTRKFTLPEVIDVVDIPGEQRALGVPMKLRAVRTKLSLPDAQANVMKQFGAAGLYVPPAKHITQTVKEPIIVALDPTTLVAYTAIFQPNEKSTTVVLGTAFLARREKTGLPEWGPVYPGVKEVIVTDVELMRAASYVVFVEEKKVRDFYEKVLPSGGFKKVSDEAWDRGRERIQIIYSKDKDGAVRVLMTHSMSGGTE